MNVYHDIEDAHINHMRAKSLLNTSNFSNNHRFLSGDNSFENSVTYDGGSHQSNFQTSPYAYLQQEALQSTAFLDSQANAQGYSSPSAYFQSLSLSNSSNSNNAAILTSRISMLQQKLQQIISQANSVEQEIQIAVSQLQWNPSYQIPPHTRPSYQPTMPSYQMPPPHTQQSSYTRPPQSHTIKSGVNRSTSTA